MMPVQLKAALLQIAAGLLVIFIFFLMIWAIFKGWQPRTEVINGHEYIVYPEMEGVEMEHSPECYKCK